MRILPYLKEVLLCKNSRYLFCYSNGAIVVRRVDNQVIVRRKRIHILFASFPLLARLLRLIPRVAVALSEDECIISDRGKIIRYSVSNNSIAIEHHFIKGMSAPISFCIRHDLYGNVDDILYGEYTQNPRKEAVSIFRRNGVDWVKAFSFPPNTIKHIHNIIVDKKRKRYLILTGDDNTESGIWESDYEFCHVRPLISGRQQLRSCVLLPLERELYYITDTPLETNYVYKLSINMSIERICEVNGPCIFGCINNNSLFFSTSVEGNAHKSGIRYLVSNKLGKGVKSRYSCLYQLSPDGKVTEIVRIEKDGLPFALFEFGNIKFPSSDDDKVYFCPQSLKSKYGTYIIEDIVK